MPSLAKLQLATFADRRSLEFGTWASSFKKRKILFSPLQVLQVADTLQKVAYEDIRLAPESSLFYELDKQQMNFSPLAQFLIKVQREEQLKEALAARGYYISRENEKMFDEPIKSPEEDEAAVWASHPIVSWLIVRKTLKTGIAVDITKSTSISVPEKDIGVAQILALPALPYSLKIMWQEIRKKMLGKIGDKKVSEKQLEFIPY